MGQFFSIHPENPQPRLIKEAVKIIEKGGVIIYPTDSTYAIGCQIANKDALERIRLIRQIDERHNFTLVCRDISEMSIYGYISNGTFKLVKTHVPGPYTFILKATKEVPKRLMHPKRDTIGIRIPDCNIVTALLSALNQPLMSLTLMLPDQEFPFVDPQEIYEALDGRVDLVIDGGACSTTPTSVIDFTSGEPVILRVGKGDVEAFL